MPALDPLFIAAGLICAVSLSFMLLTLYTQHVKRRQGLPVVAWYSRPLFWGMACLFCSGLTIGALVFVLTTLIPVAVCFLLGVLCLGLWVAMLICSDQAYLA